jgi:hypothetical protein
MKGFGFGDKAETWTPMKSTKSEDKIKSMQEAREAAISFAESVS